MSLQFNAKYPREEFQEKIAEDLFVNINGRSIYRYIVQTVLQLLVCMYSVPASYRLYPILNTLDLFHAYNVKVI